MDNPNMRFINFIFHSFFFFFTICNTNAEVRILKFNRLDTTNQLYSNTINFLQCHLQNLPQSKLRCSILCNAEEMCIGYDFKNQDCYTCFFNLDSPTYTVKGEFYAQQLIPTPGEYFYNYYFIFD